MVDGEVTMNQSSLDGESADRKKQTPDPSDPPGTKADVFLYSGTVVTEGSGTMLVLAVGPNSVAGMIKAAVYGDPRAAWG